MLRQEVYADDAGPDAIRQQIERASTPTPSPSRTSPSAPLQPRGGNRHAVFFTHAREAITYHYERNPADPRIQHALTLEVDDFGNVLKEAAIGYGRRATIRVVDDNGNVQQVLESRACRTRCSRSSQANDRAAHLHRKPRHQRHRVTPAALPHPAALRGAHLRADRLSGHGRRRALPGRRISSSPIQRSPDRLRHQLRRPRSPTRTHRRPATTAAAPSNGCARSTAATIWARPAAARAATGTDRSRCPAKATSSPSHPACSTQVFQRPHAASRRALLPDPAAVLGGQAATGRLPAEPGYKATVASPSDADDHWWIPSGRSFFSYDPDASPDGRAGARPGSTSSCRAAIATPSVRTPSSTSTTTTC